MGTVFPMNAADSPLIGSETLFSLILSAGWWAAIIVLESRQDARRHRQLPCAKILRNGDAAGSDVHDLRNA